MNGCQSVYHPLDQPLHIASFLPLSDITAFLGAKKQVYFALNKPLGNVWKEKWMRHFQPTVEIVINDDEKETLNLHNHFAKILARLHRGWKSSSFLLSTEHFKDWKNPNKFFMSAF